MSRSVRLIVLATALGLGAWLGGSPQLRCRRRPTSRRTWPSSTTPRTSIPETCASPRPTTSDCRWRPGGTAPPRSRISRQLGSRPPSKGSRSCSSPSRRWVGSARPVRGGAERHPGLRLPWRPDRHPWVRSRGGRLRRRPDQRALRFSTVETSTPSNAPWPRSDTTGTQFAGGPATLPENNGSSVLTTSSLPTGAKNVYGDGTESAVALMPYSTGSVIFLGWDWGRGSDQGGPGSCEGGLG